jgi:hypothetical protein
MENLSPSRIQPLSPGEEKNRDPEPPKKSEKMQTERASIPPPPLVEGENEEKHQLDERA